MPRQEPSFERYQVNVLVDNKDTDGAPVVFESNPTYNNLFGRIEHVMQYGGVAVTDFTMIRSGALHRANGGYLVIDAREVLMNPFVWDSLKRCIRNSEIRIEDVLEQYRFMTMVSLKPEPVQMRAKIVLIGTPWIYYLLFHLDPDYRKFFKVKAEFDSRVARTPGDHARLFTVCCQPLPCRRIASVPQKRRRGPAGTYRPHGGRPVKALIPVYGDRRLYPRDQFLGSESRTYHYHG